MAFEFINSKLHLYVPAIKPLYAKLKVEHGCAVATIGASRGVVVVGGATGDDVVEFLDWDTREKWVTKGKLNRGRGKWKPLIKQLLLSNLAG